MLTHEYLLSILHYDQKTGNWTWLVDRGFGKNKTKGKKAGSLNHDGYWFIKINKKRYLSHILAWFYMTGEWPEKRLDHKKKNINNVDKFDNLRLATQSQNCANRNMRKNNTSGYKGVSWDKKSKKWRVKVSKYYFGLFECPIEAAKVYDIKSIEVYGEFARTNF